MKKRCFHVMGLLVLVGALLCPSPAPAAPIELSLSLMIPSRHTRYTYVIEPWIKKIEEQTKGKIKITVYFANALSSSPEMFDSTVSGLADISENITYVNAGRFPLTEMAMLPELETRSALATSKAMWNLYNTVPEIKNEYKGVKVLWLHSSAPMRILTTKKPIRSLEDLKNMKIWVSGAAPVRTGKALGFSPVSMAPGDVYLALEKGVIDGAMATNEIAVSRKFVDICKYFNEIEICHTPFYVVMNQQKWDSLPPDVKKVFEELSGDWAVQFSGETRDREEKEAGDAAKAKGVEFIELSAEEKVKIRNAVLPVKDAYAAELEAKGLPGKRVLEEFKKFGDR
jgi:TRAP-type C4-dicarboxylate transport system substrate-binding protein